MITDQVRQKVVERLFVLLTRFVAASKSLSELQLSRDRVKILGLAQKYEQSLYEKSTSLEFYLSEVTLRIQMIEQKRISQQSSMDGYVAQNGLANIRMPPISDLNVFSY